MRSVEMKNRCLLYYGNPVGYRTEQGVVAERCVGCGKCAKLCPVGCIEVKVRADA